MRKFVIRPVKIPITAAEDKPTGAFDYSEAELDAMSTVSKEDMDETSRWLKRIGHDDVAALFDAEEES